MPRFVSLEVTEFMEIVFACECLRSLEVLVTVEKNIYLQVLEFEIKEKGVDFRVEQIELKSSFISSETLGK